VLKLFENKFSAIRAALAKTPLLSFGPRDQIVLLGVALENANRHHVKQEGEKARLRGHLDPTTLVNSSASQIDAGTLSNDLLETLADETDLLLRYIYWKHPFPFNELADQDKQPDTSPQPDLNYSQILGEAYKLAAVWLATANVYHNVKFRGWRLVPGEEGLSFSPPNSKDFLRERVSIARHQLDVFSQTGIAFQLPEGRHAFNCYQKLLSNHMDSASIDPQSLFLELSSAPNSWRSLYSQPITLEVHIRDLFTNSYFDDFRNINVGRKPKTCTGYDLLRALKLLYFLGDIVKSKTQKQLEGGQVNHLLLCPRIKEASLVDILVRFADVNPDSASTAIDLCKFDRTRRAFDLWFTPLLPIANGVSMFLPSLPKALHPIRFGEAHLALAGHDFTSRGPAFEKDLRDQLRKRRVQVCENPIGFEASDGKQVEYDLFAWFKGYAIVGEAKCMKHCASAVEYFGAESEIRHAVVQMLRRIRLLQSEWEAIRKRAGLELPPSPPLKGKVIGVVVTNTSTFSGRLLEGVHIIDAKALMRYFEGPEMSAMTMNGPGQFGSSIEMARIWKRGIPEPSEFREYLRLPPQIEWILRNTSLKMIPIPAIGETDQELLVAEAHIEIPSLGLGRLPARKPKPLATSDPEWTPFFGRELPRNMACPCGSGNKFKRCCGRGK